MSSAKDEPPPRFFTILKVRFDESLSSTTVVSGANPGSPAVSAAASWKCVTQSAKTPLSRSFRAVSTVRFAPLISSAPE